MGYKHSKAVGGVWRGFMPAFLAHGLRRGEEMTCSYEPSGEDYDRDYVRGVES